MLTSGQLNTHIRDNQRYLHGDDGPIELVAQLSVPSLLVDGLPVDPGVSGVPVTPYDPGPIVTSSGMTFGAIPVGPPAVRVLANTTSGYLAVGKRYLCVGQAAIEVSDTNDAGQRVEVFLAWNDAEDGLTILDSALVTVPTWSSGAASRIEATVISEFVVPSDALLPTLRLYAAKTGGTGGAIGRGLKLTAYPI
jgi:hypothetical protein